MRRILPRTLFGQLVLGTVAVQTLLLACFISYLVVSQRHAAQARTHERTLQQLSRLALACAKPLAEGDTADLDEILELSRVAPTIEAARLTDLTGKTLAVTNSGGGRGGLDPYEQAHLQSVANPQVFTIRNGQMEGVAPVVVQGKPVALLWLEPNHSISLSNAYTVMRIAMTYGALGLLVNLLPIFLIVRSITNPLKKLRHATHGLIQNPDQSAAFPLPVTARNEAGDLTASFNTMVQELASQRAGLLETLALLDSMLQNAPIGFAFLDPTLSYVRLNQFLAEMDHLPIEQHLGRRPSDLFPSPIADAVEAHLAEVFRTGTNLRNVELSGNFAGQRRSWLMHFYPVSIENTIRSAGMIVVEITDRLQAEETLRRTEKLAATGRLAASIAHEINNPLEAVTNLLYLLRTYEPMDQTALGFVATAQEELERVSEITQQMLRFHRQSTSPRLTNVAEVLDSVLKLYQSRIAAAQVTVLRSVRGDTQVFAFNGELRQVFANLIGNALDAMPTGGRLRLRVRRGPGRRPDGHWCQGVRVSVADTGTGMTPDVLRRVFEAFFTTKQATGTGLGLWVSEEIVRKHFGSVRVRSRLRSGTAFSIFFPDDGLSHTHAQPQPARHQTAIATSANPDTLLAADRPSPISPPPPF
jgi:signal transduction histidine kinase/HAMP domain-containing protein